MESVYLNAPRGPLVYEEPETQRGNVRELFAHLRRRLLL